MQDETKIKALYAIFKNLNRFRPETHLALRKVERIQRAFMFYGPEVSWYGRKEELCELYNGFQFARTYTNEFGNTGFTLKA